MSIRIPPSWRKKLDRALEKTDRFLSSVIGRFIIGLIAFAPVAFAELADSDAMRETYPIVYKIYTEWPSLMVLSRFWPVVVLGATSVAGGIKDKFRANSLDTNTLLRILGEIAGTMGRKATHAHARACYHLGQTMALTHISSPQEQINALVENIWTVFSREALACGLSE